MIDEKLKQALKFTDADVEANRAGQISDSQRNKLVRGIIRRSAGLGILSLFLFVVGLVSIFGLLLFLTFWAWVFAGLLGYLLWMDVQKQRLALLRGTVDRATGLVEIETRSKSTGDVHIRATEPVLVVGGMSFEVSRYIVSAFHEGNYYTVYYILETRTLLSAEYA